MEGVELADSWTTDAHKWLNVPYDSGLSFTADPAAHQAAMTLGAAYYVETTGAERDPYNWVAESSRRARGFAVWAAIRSLGREGVEALVARTSDHARRFAAGLDGAPGARILNDVVLNQVLVRFEDPSGDVARRRRPHRRGHRRASRRTARCGSAGRAGTTFGRCGSRVSGWRTTTADVDRCTRSSAGSRARFRRPVDPGRDPPWRRRTAPGADGAPALCCNGLHAALTSRTGRPSTAARTGGLMGISAAPGMTSEEIVALSRAHTLFSWSVQGALDPIAIDHAEGVYLYTPEGKRILDFNSQLMSVNIGHGDRRVIDAITAQATKLQFVQPAFATEIRARLGAKLAEILPGDLNKVFFTLGGAEAVENAIKLARHYTGKHKLLARYRSYHGATAGAMTLTGDYRRWANEPGIVGVVRYPDTHRWGEKEPRPVEEVAQRPRGRHPVRGRPDDRGGLPRDRRRHQRHPDPARRLPQGRPRAVRQVRHPDGRRRGHGRLRAHRALVRGGPLGRGART